MQAIRRVALAIGLALPAIFALTPARALDITIYGGAELAWAMDPDGAGSADTVSLDPYIEAEINGFYAGLFASIANQSENHEVDLYFGYRNETAGGLGYDLSYIRYYYPDDGGDCCSEFALALDVSAGDRLSLSVDAALDPEAGYGATSLGAEYLVFDSLGLAADIGVTGIGSESEWDVGANYYIGDETTISLYYYDGTDYEGYLELSVSYDTTLFGG